MNDETTILTFDKKMGKLTKALGAVSAALAIGNAAAESKVETPPGERGPDGKIVLCETIKCFNNKIAPIFHTLDEYSRRANLNGTADDFLVVAGSDPLFCNFVPDNIDDCKNKAAFLDEYNRLLDAYSIQIQEDLAASKDSLANTQFALEISQGVREAMEAAAMALQKKQEQKSRKRSQSGQPNH